MKTLILTFAGTWYPDKTTSFSKNLAQAVILGVSLERKTVIFRVKGLTHDFCQKLEIFSFWFFFKINPKKVFANVLDR